MNKQLLFRTSMTVLAAFIAICLFSQVEIILDPAELIPADSGYYIGGIYKDKDKDGTDEFYNKCVDEYGDASHNESGEQQGFTYNRCMIMPTCWPKDADDDHNEAAIEHPEGYIELTKTKYVGTDSAVMGYIITPPIENLDSMRIEHSPDVSYLTNRIYFLLEVSKDNGATWENVFIEGETQSKKGDVSKWDGSVSAEFQAIKDLSRNSSIIMRIMTKPSTTEYRSQRLKIHWIKIVAEKASLIRPVTTEDIIVKVSNNQIYTEQGQIQVYNLLGQLMGSGNYITVKSGIYLVRTPIGATRKVLVK